MDELESVLNKLKRLYNERKGGCVAYAKDANIGTCYFSVNSKPKFKVLRKIEKILGGKPTYCKYDNAFTVFESTTSMGVIPYGYKFYKLLESGPNSLGFRLIDEEFATPANSKFYHPRFFSCAEKKIIGYAEKNGLKMEEVFSTKEPCYHCLPVIDSVYYLEDKKKIKKIVKEKLLRSVDGITTYEYCVYSL